VPYRFPHGDHITRKRGVYHYRRRLPRPHGGELTLSLTTRRYREAEHRAKIVDQAFIEVWGRVGIVTAGTAEVRRVVREYLKQALETDLEWRAVKAPLRPVYSNADEDLDHNAVELDLEVLGSLISDAREALGRRDFRSVRSTVDSLMEEHGLPAERRNLLALGLLEANVRFLEEAQRRTLGTSLLVLTDEESEEPAPSPVGPPVAPSAPPLTGQPESTAAQPKPKSSNLVPDFTAWREKSGVRGHTLKQDRPTLRFFQELAGDKPVDQL
jgi:hypothetical protein